MDSQPLTEDLLAKQDCVVVITDHSAYDFDWIVKHTAVLVDTRNATVGCASANCRIYKA
jgi:UDP-N-acetyl-D-glucosamine dehydrogenase